MRALCIFFNADELGQVVWVGGWVGGDEKGPSIFLKIGYSDKQDVLIPNLASKISYGF